MFEAIAERELTIDDDGRVTLQFGKPVQRTTGEWRCSFRFLGLQKGIGHAHGVDSLQALQNALEAARLALTESGRWFSWLGDPQFGTGLTRAIPIILPADSLKRIETAIDDEVNSWAERMRLSDG